MCLGCWTRWVGWSLVCQLQVGILTKDHYSPENWRLIHWHLQNFAISGALDTSLNASTCRLQWKSMMYPLVHKAHSCFPVIRNTLCTLILDFPSTYPRGKWIVCRWFQQKRTKQTYISRIQIASKIPVFFRRVEQSVRCFCWKHLWLLTSNAAATPVTFLYTYILSSWVHLKLHLLILSVLFFPNHSRSSP